MPVTRSQSGKKIIEDTDAGQGGSHAATMTSRTETGATSETASAERTLIKATSEETLTKKKTRSRDSIPIRKKCLFELEAKHKLAEIELREIQKSRELAQIQLALAQARTSAYKENEDSSEEEDDKEASERIQRWLEKQPENISPPPLIGNKKMEENPLTQCTKKMEGRGQEVQADEGLEHRSDDELRPARQSTMNEQVASLAAALTHAMKMSMRDPGRHIQELPLFNGRSDGWLNFKAAYRDTEVHYTKTENIARLRRCLRGPAAEAVSSLLISTPDPKEVLEALERRFGRPEALVLNEMEKLRYLHKITDSPRDLCIFASKVANIVAAVETLQKTHYLYNPEMVRVIIDKLTPILKNKWYDFSAGKKADIPELKKMATFLNEEADKCGAYAPLEKIYNEDTRWNVKSRSERTFTTAERKSTNSTNNKCPSCQRDHSLIECKNFLSADLNQRWEIAKKTGICFKCLRATHRRGHCKSKPCGVENCTHPHHRLLHYVKKEQKEDIIASTQEVVQSNSAVDSVSKGKRAYLKILPVTITGPSDVTIEVFALLDEGSTVTMIDETLTDALGVDGPSSTMWVQGVGGTELKHEKSKMVDLKIKGKCSDVFHTLRRARTVKRLNITTQSVSESEIEDCEHLLDIASDLTYEKASPKILIGQDNWELIVSRKIRAGHRNKPVASHTLLGWVLHGCHTSRYESVNVCGYRNEIGDNTNKNQWRLVRTKDNVADNATQTTPENFSDDHCCFHGRSFLWQPEEKWPCETKTPVEKTGEDRERCNIIKDSPNHNAPLLNIERFSKWTRMIRTAVRVLKFLDIFRKKKKIVTATLRKRTRAKFKKDTDWNKKTNRIKEKQIMKNLKEKRKIEKYPYDETLHTLIVEVENTINSRPLTHVSVSPDEPEALTPNHILIGSNSHVPTPGDFSEKDVDARQQWRRAQLLADLFWQRWVKEYRPLLQHRREPRTTGAPPKVGDVVIICDSNLPRNVWPRGRVTKTFPGNDGVIRVVDVTTANGHTLRRPTKKIVVLPVESQNCDGGRNVHDERNRVTGNN